VRSVIERFGRLAGGAQAAEAAVVAGCAAGLSALRSPGSAGAAPDVPGCRRPTVRVTLRPWAAINTRGMSAGIDGQVTR
jgi:hypothetical protein